MALPEPVSDTAARGLRCLLHQPGLTRPELATMLGVTKQTASTAVAELESRDLVEAVALKHGAAGRTAVRYGLSPRAGWVAGVDLGSTRIRVAAAGLDGRVIKVSTVTNPDATVQRTWPGQLERAAHLLADVARELAHSEAGLLGATISVPRTVPAVYDLIGDHEDSADVALLEALAPIAPAAVWVENDVNCGAAAQLRSDAAQPSTLYLHIGEGIGSAFVVAGAIVRGARGRAGEIKDLPSPVPDRPGTAEAALGAGGLLAAAGHSSGAPLLGAVDDLFRAAALGDAAAESAIDTEAQGLARLIEQLCAVVDPTEVVLGGLLGARVDLRERVVGWSRRLGIETAVVADPFGDTASVVGAAALAAEFVLDAVAPALDQPVAEAKVTLTDGRIAFV